MPVIDFRIRPPYGEFLDALMYTAPERRDRFTRQLGFEPDAATTQKSVAALIADMDAAGIDLGVVTARQSGYFGSVSNETVLAFAAEYPGRFVPVAAVDPSSRRKAIDTIEATMAAGCRGVNIEPGAYDPPLYADDRRLYPIYAHCEDRGIPVILMTGGNAGPDLSYSFPVPLDRVLGDFPTLKVMVSHGNWPWVHQVLHVAYRRPNLYVSPDMYFANMPGMEDYIRAANGFLADRIVYASCFPLCPVKAYYEWFRKLPIAPENMERILWKNAEAFLGRKLI